MVMVGKVEDVKEHSHFRHLNAALDDDFLKVLLFMRKTNVTDKQPYSVAQASVCECVWAGVG